MRVALSMLTLAPGLSGGSETYARALARALGGVGVHTYEAFAPRTAPDAGSGLPTRVAGGVPARPGATGRLGSMAGLALRHGELRAELDAADVVHYPLTVPVPPVSGPTVVTLHDLQHRDLPRLFDPATRAFRRLAYDRAARRATHVIVISEWTRGRAIEALGLEPARVHTVPLGVDHDRFSPDPAVEREPFLLYPARPWPHKNHDRLFEAMALIRRERPCMRLVLTGAGHDLARLPEGTESLGSIPVEELVSLYRRASALVFPSLYEGFGLPPLEAMACGCPVASSSAASLPEVCGDAAVYFDPTDPRAIARGVQQALEASTELAARGQQRSVLYSWELTAQAHDLVFERAAGAQGRQVRTSRIRRTDPGGPVTSRARNP